MLVKAVTCIHRFTFT